MIIQLRGTSGSGKTTAMREIIKGIAPLDQWESLSIPKRKKPIGYRYDLPNGTTVGLLGHYESTCGGCDNVGGGKACYPHYIDWVQIQGFDVILSEGLLLSEDVKWTSELVLMMDVRIIYLMTDVEECIRRIKQRRKEAGNDKPLNESNTRNRVRVIKRSIERFRASEDSPKLYFKRDGQVAPMVLNWIQDRDDTNQ